jgi:hypothetical protein
MVMTGITIVVAIGVSILFGRWKKGRGSPFFILSALPLALLFLTAPVPPTIWGMIRGFQRVATTGVGGFQAVAPVCLAVSRSLWLGSIGFAVTLLVAGVLQFIAGRENDFLPQEGEDPDRQRVWQYPLLFATSLLVVPAAALVHLAAGIPRMLVGVAAAFDKATQAGVDRGSMGAISATISERLVASMVAGVSLTLLLVIAAAACIFAVRSRQLSDRLNTYSWALLVVCMAAAVLYALQLMTDMRALQLALR